MGKSQQKQVQQEGTAQLNTQNQTNATNNATAQGASNFLMPALQNEYNNPGYTAQQKSAITQGTEGGIGAAAGAATQAAANTAARTNNSATTSALQDDIARQRMQTTASATQGNELAFANKAQQNQQQALQGIQGVYGTSQGAATAGANTGVGTLGVLNSNANQPSWWQSLLQSGIQAGGQVGAAAVGHPCWIAAVVFDEDFATGPRVIAVRNWLVNDWAKSGPFAKFVVALYGAFGRRAAKVIAESPVLKRIFRKLFDRALDKALGS